MTNRTTTEANERITLPMKWAAGLLPIGERDPYSRLLGSIEIGGASFHIEAWEVRESRDGEQYATDENIDDWYEFVAEQITCGAGETITINGRDYFIVITPFQQ